MSLERLDYDLESEMMTYTSDRGDGPTAVRHGPEAAAFIAQLVARMPDGAKRCGA